MACRQHGRTRLQDRRAIELDLNALGLLAQGGDVARDDPKPALGPAHGISQKILEVAPVVGTRREIVAPEAAAVVGQPLDEMVGLVGKGAHVAGADVQEVASASRRIGDAQRRLGSALDHGDAKVAPADDLGGEQNAAGAAADDGDVGGGVRKITHEATMEAPCRQGQPAPPPRTFRRPGSR